MTSILAWCCVGTAARGESVHGGTASDHADVHGWRDISSEMRCFNIKDIHIETKWLMHAYETEMPGIHGFMRPYCVDEHTNMSLYKGMPAGAKNDWNIAPESFSEPFDPGSIPFQRSAPGPDRRIRDTGPEHDNLASMLGLDYNDDDAPEIIMGLLDDYAKEGEDSRDLVRSIRDGVQ